MNEVTSPLYTNVIKIKKEHINKHMTFPPRCFQDLMQTSGNPWLVKRRNPTGISVENTRTLNVLPNTGGDLE